MSYLGLWLSMLVVYPACEWLWSRITQKAYDLELVAYAVYFGGLALALHWWNFGRALT